MTHVDPWDDLNDLHDKDPEAAIQVMGERFDCIFGDQCCMPSYHFPSECHTAEMMDAIADEYADEKGQEHG